MLLGKLERCLPIQKLFSSLRNAAEVVGEAISVGALGYVVKIDVGSELLIAVDTVLRGEQFLSRTAAHSIDTLRSPDLRNIPFQF